LFIVISFEYSDYYRQNPAFICKIEPTFLPGKVGSFNKRSIILSYMI